MAESSIQEKRARRRRQRKEDRTETNAEETSSEKGVTEKKGYATPSQRKSGTTDGGGNAVTRWFGNVAEYFEGVRSELEKVTWPTREETVRLTYIVAAVTVASALLLGGLSIIFTELFNIGVDTPLIFVGVFVAFVALMLVYGQYSSRNSADL